MKKFRYAKLNNEELYLVFNWNEDQIIQYTTQKKIAEEITNSLNKAEEEWNYLGE